MVNEGLQEVLHTAARGENVTCFMLDNGVFGETGGHMTATTALGQRTKNTLDGRDAEQHGFPIRVSNLIAELDGAAYVARGAVNNAGNVARTKKMIRRALETQEAGLGFSFVEILTMCPTGWFVETPDAPDYLTTTLAPVHAPGVLKDVGLTEASDDRRRRVPVERRRRAARAAPGAVPRPRDRGPALPRPVRPPPCPARSDELTDDDRAVWARADAALALDLPAGIGELAPGLRWVQAIGAGIDHLDACGLPDDLRHHQRGRCRRRADRRVRDGPAARGVEALPRDRRAAVDARVEAEVRHAWSRGSPSV